MITDEQYWKKIEDLIGNYVKTVRQELLDRWRAWKINLTTPETYEVIGGLMARQVSLATNLACSPSIWNAHIAPIVLRSMVDTYITFAWIFEQSLDRARLYIEYGLGQEKLIIEHTKAGFKAAGENSNDNAVIKTMENWLDSQRYSFLTEVNLGSWSGKNTREMAEEANCMSIYRHAYLPFSSAVHSVWNHVCKYNLKHCSNPLHRYHRLPVDPELQSDIDYIYRAAKYVEKTFKLFDDKAGVSIKAVSAFEQLVDSIEAFHDNEQE